MNIKKIFIISLILMFLVVPVSFADDGDYTIPSAVNEITVQDDGATIITEDIIYDIEGRVNGVYRDIPHDNEQRISNITVETPGYYNTVEIINKAENTKIKVWLYKDAAKTQKINGDKVEVKYNYTFNKGVKIYNDIAELQYQSWGNQWKSGVDNLKTIIHIPGTNEATEYWNNPDTHVVSSTWTNSSTLETQLQDLSGNSLFEQRILMPTSYFKSHENAKVINIDAKAQIEEDQRKYAEKRDHDNFISQIITSIFGLLMIIPAGIYAIFGREPKINYKADYEYDLPTNSSIIEVNSIVDGNAGEINDKAMYATILQLINDKYYDIISSLDEDTIIRQTNKDTTNLKDYEKALIKYLSKFSRNGDISLKSISNIEDPTEYTEFKESWIKKAEKEVPESLITKYFDDKGSTIFTIFALIMLVIGIIGFIVYLLMDFEGIFATLMPIVLVGLIIEAIIMFSIPNTVPGRWTPEGKEYHDKWANFKNYIQDFSLIKEHPPASVEIWGKYIIYATALGCADEVSKNMKKYFDMIQISDDYFYETNAVRFVYFGGFNHMESSFSTLTKEASNSDGIGSAGGGGFGGGGGGTF